MHQTRMHPKGCPYPLPVLRYVRYCWVAMPICTAHCGFLRVL